MLTVCLSVSVSCLSARLSVCLQGVVEYAIALFFNKLVSYTFLFWLPLYIKNTRKNLQES